MMMRMRWLAVLIAGVLGTATAAAQERSPVVVIAIDGLRPDYVLEPARHGRPIPHLAGFVARGAWAEGVVGVVPTVTYPSFTTVLTGVNPARHGIVANTTFDPLRRNQDGWYWYTSDIQAPTLWHAARSGGLRTASVHWPVSVGAPVDWNLPQIWRTGSPDDRKLLRALGTAGLQDTLEALLREPYADGIDESIEGDERRARFAARLLELERPDFATLYFTALDHEQHVYGPHTPQAYDALARIDALVGGLLATIERVYGGRAVVAVTSDHGFEPSPRALGLASALRERGLIRVGPNGAVTEWDAAPWVTGSSAAVVLARPDDAALERRVAALLDTLAADGALGIDRVLGRSELERRGGFPGASFLVGLESGWMFANGLTDPLVGPAGSAGMHGHLPDNPALRASFFVRGPGISPRPLGLIRLVDEAPTLARLMGVDLPDAEGTPLKLR